MDWLPEGHLCQQAGLVRLGKVALDGSHEWSLITQTHNLLKLHAACA